MFTSSLVIDITKVPTSQMQQPSVRNRSSTATPSSGILSSVLLACVLSTLLALMVSAELVTHNYTLAVLDNSHTPEKVVARFGPTFTDLVNFHAERLEAGFRMKTIALSFDPLEAAVKDKLVDFTYSNPGQSASLAQIYGMTPIASVENMRLGRAQAVFGGVVLTFRGSSITTITDCGKPTTRLAAVSPSAFGGFVMQMQEMKAQGVDISTIDRSKIIVPPRYLHPPSAVS